MIEPIILPWPGGEHPFHLSFREWKVIQDQTGYGPEHILMRMQAGHWHNGDFYEVIRNGLIGGGMNHVDALKTTKNAFDNHPPISFKVTALNIAAYGLYGAPDDMPGEARPVEDPTPDNQKTDDGSLASL